jgi:hypothetical protein
MVQSQLSGANRTRLQRQSIVRVDSHSDLLRRRLGFVAMALSFSKVAAATASLALRWADNTWNALPTPSHRRGERSPSRTHKGVSLQATAKPAQVSSDSADPPKTKAGPAFGAFATPSKEPVRTALASSFSQECWALTTSLRLRSGEPFAHHWNVRFRRYATRHWEQVTDAQLGRVHEGATGRQHNCRLNRNVKILSFERVLEGSVTLNQRPSLWKFDGRDRPIQQVVDSTWLSR